MGEKAPFRAKVPLLTVGAPYLLRRAPSWTKMVFLCQKLVSTSRVRCICIEGRRRGRKERFFVQEGRLRWREGRRIFLERRRHGR